ncbi:MAG: methionyl-tRNA formyltransferase [Opitutales bacterium]|nr:methionyl-tRNA formyltransferase [Opitutales bacterium]
MNNQIYRVAFFGSDEIALPFLEFLHKECDFVRLSAVLTQPDRRSGRGRKMSENPIKRWALDRSVPCRSPDKPTGVECDWLQEERIDSILVMAYGHILKKQFLEVAPAGCYNLHASLLPQYRGASPIETAIAMGEDRSGVTLMRIIPRMDAGPIVDSESISISSTDTGPSLRLKLSQSCIPLIKRNIARLVRGKAEESIQVETESSYCRKLNKEDGNLNFTRTAQELSNRIRAFQAWPGCSFFHDGQKFRIGSAESKSDPDSLREGETKKDEEGNFIIGTKHGVLRVLEIQKPGGKMLKVSEFLRGFNFPFGEILESLEMKDLTH